MVDIADNELEDFPAEEPAAPVSAGEAAPPAAEATSPLIKFLDMIKGKKKTSAGGGAVPAAPAPAPVPAVKAPPPAAPRKPETGQPQKRQVAPVPMPAGPLVTVMTRNEFYRDGFRNLIRIAILEALIIVGLLIAFISFMSTEKSQDRYFATTADGRIMQLLPLDQPNMTTAALMSWVAQATSEVMSFSYSDYQRRLQQSSRHFTQRGWATFAAALQASHILDGIQANKESLTASPRSAPILVQEGVINGKYRWIVKLPLQVNYDSLSTARNDNLNVTLVIERVPSLENPNGVGIEQWIATQG